MFDTDLSALDPDATLSDVAVARSLSERAEVRILQAAAHWADLHASLDKPGAVGRGVALPGTERLLRLGGAGTPEVAEFAPAELGAVLAVSPHLAARLVADALDLRHRLPKLWVRVQAGEVKPWIARKTAEGCRQCSVETAAVIDRRVTPWADRVSWGRLEAIIDAVLIQADPAAAAVRQGEESVGVWLSPSNDHGIKSIYIRAEAPDAIWFGASVDRVADGLKLLGDQRPNDARRAAAVGVLARPQLALDLFAQTAPAVGGMEAPSEPRLPTGVDSRPPITLYVHLTQDALTDRVGVARVEGVGPVTVDRVRSWLRHGNVTVRPVLDLADQTPVDAYEVPDRMRDAIHLRSPIDVFPYATSTSRRKDADHTIAYVPPDDGGPPGQTRTDNLGPMTRFHHRIKTHGRWQVTQPFDGVLVWKSPHGRHFIVDHTGTRPATNRAS